jgi:hypothetical protein
VEEEEENKDVKEERKVGIKKIRSSLRRKISTIKKEKEGEKVVTNKETET